jgi:ubiquinone/menaquinone biosynthesis C-methylase UbiE
VCDGATFSPLYPGTVPDDDTDPVAYFSSSRLHVGHHPIVRCCGCGLVMTNPRDDDATLAATYRALEDRAYYADEDNREHAARDHLAVVRRHHPSPGRLLDVGCATGSFVRAASLDRWEVTGLDTSTWALERARERCPGARLVQGLAEPVELPQGSFDVVTMWDTFEHVSSPAAVLASVRQWLAPGGWVFLNLPNCGSWPARLMRRRWVLLLREHLWYFSPRTIGSLLERHGFSCVETAPDYRRFSLDLMARRIGQYPGAVGRLALSAASRGLPRVGLRIPVGEMIVVARSAERA